MPNGGRLSLSTRSVTFQERDLPYYPEARPAASSACRHRPGIGIGPPGSDALLEPFYRTKGWARGVGLGLRRCTASSTSRRLDHVYSEKTGHLLKRYLPTVQQPPPPRRLEPPDWQDGRETHADLRDEASICQLDGRVLSEHGYRVTMALIGEEAERLFRRTGTISSCCSCRRVPDTTPPPNGVELVDSLRRHKPGFRPDGQRLPG
jgi:hypothetical protein